MLYKKECKLNYGLSGLFIFVLSMVSSTSSALHLVWCNHVKKVVFQKKHEKHLEKKIFRNQTLFGIIICNLSKTYFWIDKLTFIMNHNWYKYFLQNIILWICIKYDVLHIFVISRYQEDDVTLGEKRWMNNDHTHRLTMSC